MLRKEPGTQHTSHPSVIGKAGMTPRPRLTARSPGSSARASPNAAYPMPRRLQAALRSQPPQPSAPRTSTPQATSFGSECVQDFPLPGFPVGGAEACLFINVWATQNAPAGAILPVMVQFHGGGFVIGNGNGDNTLLASAGDELSFP